MIECDVSSIPDVFMTLCDLCELGQSKVQPNIPKEVGSGGSLVQI